MARELPIRNGRLTTDLDADGHKIKNLPPGEGFTQAQADWNQSDSTKPDFIKNKPTIPASITVDSALSPTSTNPVQNRVVKAALDAKVSRAEMEAGFTEWTISPDSLDGIPFRVSWDDEYKWILGLVSEAVSEAVGFSDEPQDAVSLTFTVAEIGTVTATRIRLPTVADLALKADKGEMSVVPGTGADVDKTTIQLKSGTSATVLTEHQQLQEQFTEWTFAAEDGFPSDLRLILTDEGWVPASDSYGYPLGAGEPLGDGSSTALTWSLGSSPFGEFSATRAVAGYVLGSQTTKPLQPQGDYLTEHQSLAGLMPMYPFTAATVENGVITVSPYTGATYTADSSAAAFEIAVGALPTGVTGMMRDCILVIDCTATGAVAPTVTWGTHFHPRTDTATDLAIVEAGKRAVFYISEYAPGEFAVGGWTETAGGNA